MLALSASIYLFVAFVPGKAPAAWNLPEDSLAMDRQ